MHAKNHVQLMEYLYRESVNAVLLWVYLKGDEDDNLIHTQFFICQRKVLHYIKENGIRNDNIRIVLRINLAEI